MVHLSTGISLNIADCGDIKVKSHVLNLRTYLRTVSVKMSKLKMKHTMRTCVSFPQIPSLRISFPWSRNMKGTKQHDAGVIVVVKNIC